MLKKISIIALSALVISANCHGQESDNGNLVKAGNILQDLIPLTALGTTIFYEKGSEGTIQFLKSYVTAVLATEGLKKLIDKQRPNGGCCDSFPSKHATKAFVGAAFIQKRYGWKYAIPAYLGASYVAYGRVEADKHYWGDVAAGAAIGVLSGYIFTKPYKTVRITPFAAGDFIGFNLTTNW